VPLDQPVERRHHDEFGMATPFTFVRVRWRSLLPKLEGLTALAAACLLRSTETPRSRLT